MNYLLAEIDPVHHINILLMLGIAAFAGTIGARLFQKLKIPQVVGYIVIGILLGTAVLNIANKEVIKSLSPLNLFALGLIGFRIGGELKIDAFKKYGKQFTIILLSEGMFAFFVVSVLVSVLAGLFTHNWRQSIALGLLLGAISSATAPAATVDVLWEYKTRGILTRTVLAIVALDDGLSLFLYGFAASIAGVLTENSQSLIKSFLFPLWEIFGGIAIGAAAGGILLVILKTVTDKAKVLTFSLALIAMTMGLSKVMEVEGILAAMVAGAVITNFRPRKSQSLFELDEFFAPPIYALFFVLVGARLEIANLPMWMFVLALAYVIGRTGGKMFGAWFGARISGSSPVVRKYLGYCLFSQAGVAIGLSILAGERFAGYMGEAIIMIITTTTFIVQIIGPPFVKYAAKKAGEIGMNITEDDLIASYTVADVMDKKSPVIAPGMSLCDVIRLVSSTDSFYYAVVDINEKLVGAITLDGIRNTFATQELHDWLIALDITQPVITKVRADMPLADVFEEAGKLDIEYIPVTENDNFIGLLDCPAVRRSLSAEILFRQKKADTIHST